MTDFWTVYEGFTVMVMTLVISFVLVFAGGLVIDTLFGTVEDVDLYGSLPGDSPWLEFTARDVVVNFYYIVVGVVLPFAGIGAFYLSITRQHRWDLEQNTYYNEEY